MRIGGQEHFYLETQAVCATPGEDESAEMHLLASTQSTKGIQEAVHHILGMPMHRVTVKVRVSCVHACVVRVRHSLAALLFLHVHGWFWLLVTTTGGVLRSHMPTTLIACGIYAQRSSVGPSQIA